MDWKRTALPVITERRKGRKQFCAFSARPRFYTASKAGTTYWTDTPHPTRVRRHEFRFLRRTKTTPRRSAKISCRKMPAQGGARRARRQGAVGPRVVEGSCRDWL